MHTEDNKRVKEIIRILRETYPDARVTLDFSTPHELLVATILAAQCTDAKVNQVTKSLFKKYRSPEDFARADPKELEKDIRATGFFRQKARSIIESSQDIVDLHGGKLPDAMEELTQLRGVGRKTANVVLGNAFGKPAIIVDTHVSRIAMRLGLTEKKEPDKIERDLMAVTPTEEWTHFSHLLVALGRDICIARKPKHDMCSILHLCPTGQAEVGA